MWRVAEFQLPASSARNFFSAEDSPKLSVMPRHFDASHKFRTSENISSKTLTPEAPASNIAFNPVDACPLSVRNVLSRSDENLSRKIIFPDPGGVVFTQDKAKELAAQEQLIFVCGHYEGFDARIYDLADELISIGDYV